MAKVFLPGKEDQLPRHTRDWPETMPLRDPALAALYLLQWVNEDPVALKLIENVYTKSLLRTGQYLGAWLADWIATAISIHKFYQKIRTQFRAVLNAWYRWFLIQVLHVV